MRSRIVPVILPAFVGVLAVGSGTVHDSGGAGQTARARQWPLDALETREAWRRSKGEGVTVALLDTGVNPRHPDLAGAIVEGPDFIGAGDDRHGRHGTSMASLIGGRGHGRGHALGVVGVAPKARILSIRVTLENDDPLRSKPWVAERGHDAVAKGIRYATRHGAQVINMSLGGGGGGYEGSAAEEEAVQFALRHGVVLVASAGNDGHAANRRNFPAAYPGVIAVGAVDRRLRRAPFSNHRGYLSVMAPGTGIVSADGARSYVVGEGTSPAAAFVAGIAALIRSRHPRLSPYQVRRAIERGATHRPRGGHTVEYGNGVADARLALEFAAQADRMPPPTPAGASSGYFGGGPDTGDETAHHLIVLTLLLLLVAAVVRLTSG